MNRTSTHATVAFLLLVAFGLFSGCRMRGPIGAPERYVKPVVAVESFDNRAPFPLKWNLGDGMADQLLGSLARSGRVTIVSRSALPAVFQELNMQNDPRFRSEGRATPGRLKNAQYLVRGTITDFTHTAGGGLHFLRGLSHGRTSAQVAVVTLALILLFIVDSVEVWHVFVAMALRGIGGAFHFPAMVASTSLMVPKKHMTRIGGLNQAVNGVVGIVSPAIAATLIIFLPMEWVLSFDVVTATIAVIPLLFIMIPQPARDEASAEKPPSVLREMKEGFAFLRAWPGMIALLLLIMPINMVFAPVSALMPIYVTEFFQKGVEELAMVEISFGLSFVIGGLALGVWGGTKRKMYTILGAGVVTGLAGIGVGLVPSHLFVLSLFWFFVTGFAVAIMNGCAIGVLQTTIRADMQGRVFSLVGSATMAMTPLGLIIAGPVADAAGVPVWFLMAGAVTTALMIGGFLSPSVLKLEDVKVDQLEVEEK